MLRHLLRQAALGVVVGWVLVVALLCADIGSLGTLIDSSPDGNVALALLLAGFSVTFGGLAMATGIFLLPPDEPNTRGGRLVPQRAASRIPAVIPARAAKR